MIVGIRMHDSHQLPLSVELALEPVAFPQLGILQDVECLEHQLILLCNTEVHFKLLSVICRHGLDQLWPQI